MMVVVGGCRNYENFEELSEFIDFCIKDIKKENELIFLSGGCRGTDILGERYAMERGYKVLRFSADWRKYGRAAGPIRNEKMVQKADLVIAFWDGKSKGTGSLIKYAKKYNKNVKVKTIDLKQ